jgi:hypothetical protein
VTPPTVRAIIGALLIVVAGSSPAPAGAPDGEPAAPAWADSDRPSLMVHEALPSLEPRSPGSLPSWLSGGSPLGLGVDVSPLRLLDPGTAISFDLKLGWPSATASPGIERGTLHPYVTFGPTLFVNPSPDAESLLGPSSDPTLTLGVKAGAGLSLWLDRDAVLFGEYRLSHGGVDALSPLGGRGEDVRGYEILYGVRFRF